MRRKAETCGRIVRESTPSSSPTTLVNFHNAATMSSKSSGAEGRAPIFLLKTKSTPNDGYEEQFSAEKDGLQFKPVFVPVLEHQFLEPCLDVVRELLQSKQIGRYAGKEYGGMIFTSQRAVEAFVKLVEEGKGTQAILTLSLQHLTLR
jgi:hypothetical protein